jgi:hypothetical protein
MEGEPSNKRARQEEPHRGPATGQATASSAESSGQTTAARPRFRVSAQDHHNRRFPHYSQPRYTHPPALPRHVAPPSLPMRGGDS